MIEILFNHREGVSKGYTLVDRLTIGHGVPWNGQLDFISLITEENYRGELEWATFKWGLGWHRTKKFLMSKFSHYNYK